MENTQLKVFIIYARKDEELKDELVNHLIPFERRGFLKVWNDREIKAGEQWELAILQNLKEADIVLPLISSDFFASEYIDNVEMREAVTRHHNGEILMLPIIVRPCAWNEDSLFSVLQVLPRDGKAVDDKRHWHNHDVAWDDAVRGIQSAIPSWLEQRSKRAALVFKTSTETTQKEEKSNENSPKIEQKKDEQALAKSEKPASKSKKNEPKPLSPPRPTTPKKEQPQEKLTPPAVKLQPEPAPPPKKEIENTPPQPEPAPPPRPELVLPKSEPPAPKIDEEKLWADAIKSQNPELIAEYLRIFPEGKYKSMAQLIVEKNIFEKSKKINSAVEEEKAFYQAVQKANSIEKCDEYLKAYPNGIYRVAVQKIKETIIQNNKVSEREQFLYNEAARLKSIESFRKYLDEFKNGRFAKEICTWYDLKLREMEIEKCAVILEKNRLKLLLDFYSEFAFNHSKYLPNRSNSKNEVLQTINLHIGQKREGLSILCKHTSTSITYSGIVGVLSFLFFAIITTCGIVYCSPVLSWQLWNWGILSWGIVRGGAGLMSLIVFFNLLGLSYYWLSALIKTTSNQLNWQYPYSDAKEKVPEFFFKKALPKWLPAFALVLIFFYAAYHFNHYILLWVADVILIMAYLGVASTAKNMLEDF